MEKGAYPMRINKYLAFKNFCTRREADEIIRKGQVKINGRLAVLGDKILEQDNVEIDAETFKDKKYIYFAFNKPRGIITHSPQGKEKSIEQIFKFSEKVFPVGRLDKDSSGLIILTNDGRITDKLLNPDFYHEKEYIVKVDREMSPSFLKHMEEGVVLGDGYKTRKCVIKKIDNFIFSIILTEGKKHQIRKMCERLDRSVRDLKRVRIMNIELGNLPQGQSRKIEGQEQAEFLAQIGLKVAVN
jgi:23S rRNA pseudouridine2604 synthase